MIDHKRRHERLVDTMLSNRGYNIAEMTAGDKDTAHREIRSQIARSAYDKWLASNLNRAESFSERSKRGIRNIAIKHLCSDTSEYSDDELFEIGCALMHDESHGERVKQGIRAKHPDIKSEYKRRVYARAAHTLNIPIDELTPADVGRWQRVDVGFYNHNPLEWKRTHIINHMHVVPKSDEDVERLYSEYASSRYKRATLECISNGWKTTKKGWYAFASGAHMFYRSSWEEVVFKLLDELEQARIIAGVFVPKRIAYSFQGINRFYYPDVGWTLLEGKSYVAEIKPRMHVASEVNSAKIAAGVKTHGSMFVVMTEDIVFNECELRRVING